MVGLFHGKSPHRKWMMVAGVARHDETETNISCWEMDGDGAITITEGVLDDFSAVPKKFSSFSCTN